MAPSKGERLIKRIHKGHKPGDVLPYRSRAVKVVRMFQALQENGWTFRFKVEAVSPRGWSYFGEGAVAEEAFLRAFGSWEQELAGFVRKIPDILAKTEEPKVITSIKPIHESRKYRKSNLAWISRRWGQQAYIRHYMRQYRKDFVAAA